MRAGQTEGGVDLTRLAGLEPGAVICEIMNPDGTMMRLDGLLEFGQKHNIKVVTIADLIAYRMQKESFVRAVADVELPTDFGTFRAVAFENELDTRVHLALVMGDIRPEVPTLVRVHRADLMADVFGFAGTRGVNRLETSLRTIANAGAGVVLYLRSGANGEMAVDSLSQFLARRRGLEAQRIGMDFREFGIGAQILSHLGLSKIRVMTNSENIPFVAVRGFGLEIVDRVPIEG